MLDISISLSGKGQTQRPVWAEVSSREAGRGPSGRLLREDHELLSSRKGSTLVSGETHSLYERAQSAPRFLGLEVSDHVDSIPGRSSYQAKLISGLSNDPEAIHLDRRQATGVTAIKQATAGGFEGEWLFAADLAVPKVFASADQDIHLEWALRARGDGRPAVSSPRALSRPVRSD